MRIQRQLSGRIGAIETARAFHHHAAGLADFQLIERDRFRPVAQLRHEWTQILAGGYRRGRCRARSPPRPAIRPAGPPANARTPSRHRDRDDRLSALRRSASRRLPIRLRAQPALRRRRRRSRLSGRRWRCGPRATLTIAAQRAAAFDCDSAISPRPCSHAASVFGSDEVDTERAVETAGRAGLRDRRR